MTERRIPLFFYGLFMDAEALREKGFNPRNPRCGSVRGYSLRIGQRATLVPDRSGRAHGFVMDLTHEEIDRLYAEPSVSMYRAEPVLVEVDRETIAALCFNLPTPPRPEESNAAYADKLRDLARRLGLPADYIAGIV